MITNINLGFALNRTESNQHTFQNMDKPACRWGLLYQDPIANLLKKENIFFK